MVIGPCGGRIVLNTLTGVFSPKGAGIPSQVGICVFTALYVIRGILGESSCLDSPPPPQKKKNKKE